jgi:hypothetical protein
MQLVKFRRGEGEEKEKGRKIKIPSSPLLLFSSSKTVEEKC